MQGIEFLSALSKANGLLAVFSSPCVYLLPAADSNPGPDARQERLQAPQWQAHAGSCSDFAQEEADPVTPL